MALFSIHEATSDEVDNFIVHHAKQNVDNPALEPFQNKQFKLIQRLHEKNVALEEELAQLQKNNKRKYVMSSGDVYQRLPDGRDRWNTFSTSGGGDYTLRITNYNTSVSIGDEGGSDSGESSTSYSSSSSIDNNNNFNTEYEAKRAFYCGIKKSLLKLVDPKRKHFTESEVNRHFNTLHEEYRREPDKFKKRYASQVAPSRSLKYHVFKEMKRHLNSSKTTLAATTADSSV